MLGNGWPRRPRASAFSPERLSDTGRRGKRILSALGTTEASVNWSDFWRTKNVATEQDPVGKEPKTDAEFEDMILQRLVIGGVFVSVRRDPILGWRPTVVTPPKHTKNAQELADKIAAELRKRFTLKD